MMKRSVSILANLPPPSYQVQIPTEQVLWYQFAAPLFLALALLFFGWWIARSRTFRQGADRAILIACAGSLALSYSAWWIWQNRNSTSSGRDTAAIVAVEMPQLWIQFCMLAYLLIRIYLHEVSRSEVEDGQFKPKRSHWRNDVLAFLLLFGTVIPVVLAGHHALFLPFMFVCWTLAFVVWGATGFVSWFGCRLFDRATNK